MIKPETLDFTNKKMREMFTWRYFDCFTASSCGGCKKTANVPSGPGWFCECGHYNILPWSNHFIPHEKPDMGPSRRRIMKAAKSARGETFWHKLWLRVQMVRKLFSFSALSIA
jgi:hypothetical protein